jgi:hypothetical protein
LTELLFDQAENLAGKHQFVLPGEPFDAPLNESFEGHDVREKRCDKGNVFELDRLLVPRRRRSSLDLDLAIADDWNPSTTCRKPFTRVGEPDWPVALLVSFQTCTSAPELRMKLCRRGNSSF